MQIMRASMRRKRWLWMQINTSRPYDNCIGCIKNNCQLKSYKHRGIRKTSVTSRPSHAFLPATTVIQSQLFVNFFLGPQTHLFVRLCQQVVNSDMPPIRTAYFLLCDFSVNEIERCRRTAKVMLQLKWENLQILWWNLPYMSILMSFMNWRMDVPCVILTQNAHCQKTAAHNSSTNVVVHFTSFI